jgi:hypothetical protein
MTNYYDKELQRVLPDKGEVVNIKISNGTKSTDTKWLSLNLDSIDSLQAFIDIIKEDLEKEQL